MKTFDKIKKELQLDDLQTCALIADCGDIDSLNDAINLEMSDSDLDYWEAKLGIS